MIKQLNDRQEAKLNMYRATEQHVDDNIAIIAAIPAFQATYTQFKSQIAAILETAAQKVPLTGIAADKKAAKLNLSNLTAAVANVVSSYAAANNNEQLRHEMNVTASKMSRTRDDLLITLAQSIHDSANRHIASLSDYNLTAAKLTELQTAIDNYSSSTPKPRTAVSTRKTTNTNITDTFRQTDKLLETQLDKQVESLRTTNPDFVNTYFSTREIIDPPVTKPRKPKPTAEKKDDEMPN